jgi:diguanylate cyclase (GGDEF)-like protein
VLGGDVSLELGSVKVFPLTVHGEAMGALILGDESPLQELTSDEIWMLQIVAVHGATTLANARMYRRMEKMATTDGLTGLVNRRRFVELADKALARADRFGRKLSLLLIDADHFKRINDSYGHSVGDVVLKRLAASLREEARRTDVVARLGGEEFVILADETDGPGALILAERIRQRLASEPIRGSFGEISMTVSVGTSTWPEHAASKEQLLERADQALYEAKRNGRNRTEQWGQGHCIAPQSSAIASEGPGTSGVGAARIN